MGKGHHHQHWAAVVSRGWAKAAACHLQVACFVPSSARSCRSSICPGRLSIACLVSLVVFSCNMVSK